MPFFLKKLKSKLFADDTTLYDFNDDLDKLIHSFVNNLNLLCEQCNSNRLDINWKKTKFMFCTNKHVTLPIEINFMDNTVEVVTSFKLLGVTIDNKLNFRLHAANIRLIVNKKMFSIKKLFYLAFSVKLQFFKSFILPYFDYCLSLLIYFPKSTIQKLKNSYDFCLLKLFNFKISEYNLFKQKIEDRHY